MEDTARHSRRTRLTSIPAAIRRYARAERALCESGIAEYAAGIRSETPEFRRLNREAHEADLAVPRWLGWLKALIGWRTVRKLGYFARTGQQ